MRLPTSRNRAQRCSGEGQSSSPTRPQGAPRGLLLYYILHRISSKPAHGYEILQDIESKTEGGWRPGPGSVYPMLKKLLSDGLIKADPGRGTETSQRVYHITETGAKHLQEAKQMFADAAKKWSSMRRIFVEMVDPKDIGSLFIDGTRIQFEVARETLESKLGSISPSETRFLLKEYALNLERQMEWCSALLGKLEQQQQQEQKKQEITTQKIKGAESMDDGINLPVAKVTAASSHMKRR